MLDLQALDFSELDTLTPGLAWNQEHLKFILAGIAKIAKAFKRILLSELCNIRPEFETLLNREFRKSNLQIFIRGIKQNPGLYHLRVVFTFELKRLFSDW